MAVARQAAWSTRLRSRSNPARPYMVRLMELLHWLAVGALLTRGQGGAALQFEVELSNLDQLDQLRHRGGGSDEEIGSWIRAFSEILLAPPGVEILRADKAEAS